MKSRKTCSISEPSQRRACAGAVLGELRARILTERCKSDKVVVAGYLTRLLSWKEVEGEPVLAEDAVVPLDAGGRGRRRSGPSPPHAVTVMRSMNMSMRARNVGFKMDLLTIYFKNILY
jgi:hypothetical protein